MKSELSSNDKQYVDYCSKVVTALEGMVIDDLERRTSSNYPSRFIVKWINIPQITFQEWKTLIDKNSNVKDSFIHFRRNEMVIDCWKENKRPKKRSRDPEIQDNKTTWDLKDVDMPHKNKIKKICNAFGQMLTCQCACSIQKINDFYQCNFTVFEAIHYESFANFYRKNRTQITKIVIKIPKDQIIIHINPNQ